MLAIRKHCFSDNKSVRNRQARGFSIKSLPKLRRYNYLSSDIYCHTVFPRFSAPGCLLIQTVLGGGRLFEGGAYTRGALI